MRFYRYAISGRPQKETPPERFRNAQLANIKYDIWAETHAFPLTRHFTAPRLVVNVIGCCTMLESRIGRRGNPYFSAETAATKQARPSRLCPPAFHEPSTATLRMFSPSFSLHKCCNRLTLWAGFRRTAQNSQQMLW